MKKTVRLIALFAALIMCLGMLPVSAITLLPTGSSVVCSGTCGSGLTWTLDSDNVLTISGSGRMDDYSYPSSYGGGALWYSYRSRINTVDIEPGLTYIGKYAFMGLSNVTSVEIPDTVTESGYGAFQACSALTSVEIPSSLTVISQAMFAACDSLESVTISDGVQALGASAFSRCESLTEVELPDSLTEIGIAAFTYCTALETITIPASVQTIGRGAFSWDTALTYIDVDPDSSYFKSDDGVLITKDGKTLLSYPIANPRTSYSVPAGVETIDYYAFAKALSLCSVELPSSLRRIYDEGFYSCKSLTSIALPKGMTMVHNEVFAFCDSLVSVSLPSTMKTIGWRAFENCKSLSDIELPAKVSAIGHYAFQGCESLKSIAIPEGVDELHCNTFHGCASLESATLPESMRYVNGGVFSGCSSLKSMVFPENVTYIGTYCLSDCSSLESVTLPSTLKRISNYTFKGCSSLESITIPETVETIGIGAFEDCTVLDDVVIPKKVTCIYQNTFHRCKGLTTVTLPFDITVQKAGFRGCDNLKTVNYPGSKTAWKQVEIGELNLYLTKAKVNSYYKYLNYSTATIKYSNYSFTGEPVKPIVTVRTPSGTKLKKDTNYTVTYINNTDFGMASIKIEGIGKYFGELELTFNIKPAKVKDLQVTESTGTEATVSWTTVPGASEYEVRLGSTVLGRTASDSYTITGLNPARARKVWVYSIGYGADPETGETVEYRGFGAYVMVNE